MYVGMAKISVVIGQSHSLKDKRMVLRRIKDRVRERIGVVVNEVGELDTWQRAELGCAVASIDRQKASELLDDVVRIAVAAGGGEIVAIARNVVTFEGQPTPVDLADLARTGTGEKAVAADTEWVPDEWRESIADDKDPPR